MEELGYSETSVPDYTPSQRDSCRKNLVPEPSSGVWNAQLNWEDILTYILTSLKIARFTEGGFALKPTLCWYLQFFFRKFFLRFLQNPIKIFAVKKNRCFCSIFCKAETWRQTFLQLSSVVSWLTHVFLLFIFLQAKRRTEGHIKIFFFLNYVRVGPKISAQTSHLSSF